MQSRQELQSMIYHALSIYMSPDMSYRTHDVRVKYVLIEYYLI